MKIHDSLDAILESSSNFAESFYYRLSELHPEVFRHFEGVNLKRQSSMLTTALVLVVKEYEKPNEALKYYLRLLGTKHERLEIDRDKFIPWQQALLTSLAEFHGADWDTELSRQWTEAIEIAIGQMMIGYDEDYRT